MLGQVGLVQAGLSPNWMIGMLPTWWLRGEAQHPIWLSPRERERERMCNLPCSKYVKVTALTQPWEERWVDTELWFINKSEHMGKYVFYFRVWPKHKHLGVFYVLLHLIGPSLGSRSVLVLSHQKAHGTQKQTKFQAASSPEICSR